MREIKVALIGTPNVGKSTIYNHLTNSHEHTGNWSGKTVQYSYGECKRIDAVYTFYDLPGTYSLISKSKEEMVATDFICFNDYDVAVVVCDATSLDKGINLVIQTKEIAKKVVVCVNLIDEAKKKGIEINYELLSKNLSCPVVMCSARDKVGLDKLLNAIKNVDDGNYLDINYGVINKYVNSLAKCINLDINKKWVALRYLENNKHYINKFSELGVNICDEKLKNIFVNLTNVDINLEVAVSIKSVVNEVLNGVVTYKSDNNTRNIDKVLTSKLFGIPIMLGMLFIIFYLTIIGANYPSSLLFSMFSSLEDYLVNFLEFMYMPKTLIDLLVNGVYKTLYWVVSVMLPPMMIFFPLFTLLEDIGILPRIAFNLDKAFMKCNTCGKQALTMCMGLGCNAVGVTGARIIDSKRERLIAILTNVFMPCNGKFPTLIAIITMFFVGINNASNVFSALILTCFILLGVIFTFLVSFVLSKTILKGVPSSFTLELPPYRKPKIISTILTSIKTKAIFVLGRAVKVSAIAGLVIWCVVNLKINNLSILEYLINFFEPFGIMLGVDGVIILALLLGLPANEIVVPIILMCYLRTSTLIEYSSLSEFKNILLMNGWTIKTAICFLILMCFHYPCSTTLLTIKKETNSLFYTILSFLIPVIVGVALCLIVNLLF